jgi:hypothetical protein
MMIAFRELTAATIDSIEYSAEKAQAACVVVVLHGDVWIRYDYAGRRYLLTLSAPYTDCDFRVWCRIGLV